MKGRKGINATEYRIKRPGGALLASLRLLDPRPTHIPSILIVLPPNTNITITCLFIKSKMLQKYHIKNENFPSSHSQKVIVVIHIVYLVALKT